MLLYLELSVHLPISFVMLDESHIVSTLFNSVPVSAHKSIGYLPMWGGAQSSAGGASMSFQGVSGKNLKSCIEMGRAYRYITGVSAHLDNPLPLIELSLKAWIETHPVR